MSLLDNKVLDDVRVQLAKANSFETYNFQRRLVDYGTWPCCANCFSLKETICSENNLPIPPQVAVTGCAKWDGLPF